MSYDQSTLSPKYQVHNKRNRKLHLIPYVGNKSGFAHIFDDLMPDDCGHKGGIYDIFGGSGAFTTYCCFRFGNSSDITYNDNNPVLTNFMTCVRDNINDLISEYNKHKEQSSNDYFLKVRAEHSLTDGLKGAGQFFYLAKNAFSGKIRFNKKNLFNAPMRKNTRCPDISEQHFCDISKSIQNITITNKRFEQFAHVKDAFLYLDPPYMNNPNDHYNEVPTTESFTQFVRSTYPYNRIMISEQNTPDNLGISDLQFKVYDVLLRRSLQYVTQRDSKEIIAINYELS